MTTPFPSKLLGKQTMKQEVQIRLSDRLAHFDLDRQLEPNCALVWVAIKDRTQEIGEVFWTHIFRIKNNAAQFTPEEKLALQANGEAYLKAKYSAPTDQAWADLARNHAQIGRQIGDDIGIALSAFEVANQHVIDVLREYYADKRDVMKQAVTAVFRISIIEAEIMSATIAELKRLEFEKERGERADLFRDRIGAEVTSASDLGSRLQLQAGNASVATRGMLGKASEVAAAAEQSATAMRDAAYTSAGLIRAIEDARTEVDLAAGVATRAAAQASDAVKVSEALSDTAKSIESILGLIRDVAGQTNLLALNATIEAARAGDAGRGFAVVAQEVKSLANQTARATDDIAAKIAAIQSATKSAVESNGSIRDTVTEVQASANRIREAMEIQAQTVTMITAAVDETALAADTMSTTIAAIREETEDVATEIDSLESGFDSVNRKLASLQDAAGDYARLVA